MAEEFDLVYRVLDDQIVDVEGRRCGKVDDIELTGAAGGPLRVTAILTGRGAYADRLPRRWQRLARRLFGEDVRGSTVVRIPWSEVEDVTARVNLRGRSVDLGLDRADRTLQPHFERLPGG